MWQWHLVVHHCRTYLQPCATGCKQSRLTSIPTWCGPPVFLEFLPFIQDNYDSGSDNFRLLSHIIVLIDAHYSSFFLASFFNRYTLKVNPYILLAQMEGMARLDSIKGVRITPYNSITNALQFQCLLLMRIICWRIRNFPLPLPGVAANGKKKRLTGIQNYTWKKLFGRKG